MELLRATAAWSHLQWLPSAATARGGGAARGRVAAAQVIDGLSERGSHPVIRRPMRQWMLRITAYADALLDDLDGLDWCANTLPAAAASLCLQSVYTGRL